MEGGREGGGRSGRREGGGLRGGKEGGREGGRKEGGNKLVQHIFIKGDRERACVKRVGQEIKVRIFVTTYLHLPSFPSLSSPLFSFSSAS